MIQFRAKVLLCCLALSILSLMSAPLSAKVTTVIMSQDFSSDIDGGFPPSGWSTDGFGFWYGSNYGIDKGTGDGGFNGSAMFDMFDNCGAENLYSPSVDASAYNGSGATVTIDFDYWWEQTFYDQFGNNTVTIYANDGSGNQIQLAQISNSTDFTFSSGNFSENYFDPLTDPSLWGHKTYTIPAAYATSGLQIVFNADGSSVCGGGGNFGVDNIVVTGSLPQNITYAPAMLAFGSVLTGTQSEAQCVTLTNPSSVDVPINSASIGGPQSDQFTISGNVPAVIPADGSVNICVVFAPIGVGDRTADLFINNNSDNHPLIDVPLTGHSSAPVIEIDPIGKVNTSTRLFKNTFIRLGNSVEQCLLVKNIGEATLSVDPEATFIGGDFPSEYTISRIPANPLVNGQSDTLCVIYHPTMEGSHPAKLFIASNAFNGVQEVDLTGIGKLPKIVVTPAIVNFDSVQVGDTSCTQLTITNPGSDTLIVAKNYLSSNEGDFHYTGLNDEQSIIPPGVSLNVSLCFIPLQRGEREARLTLVTNIPLTFEEQRRDTGTVNVDISGTGVPTGNLSVSLSGAPTFDSALVGTKVCRQATISNTGQADITITSATIGGAQASDFSYSGITIPVTIPAQSQITVNICAVPGARGIRLGALVIGAVSSDKTSGATIPLGVFGEIACASPTPNALFSDVTLPNNGTDSSLCVWIHNCGDLAAVYSATVSGAAKADYTVTPSSSATIAPNDSAQFCVNFKPSAVGTSIASLDVTTANTATVSVPLAGVDGCAIVAAVADPVPSTGVLAKSTFNVTINNTGTFEWDANASTVTPNDGVFTVLGLDKPAAPAANGAIVVQMQFAPTILGSASAILTFPNAGPCENAPISVQLNGMGIVNSVSQSVTGDGFSLDQNYPNPFVSSTTFNYSLPTESLIRITLCDMTGKQVKELVSGRVSGGDHSVTFDASHLASGTYVYTLECGSVRLSKDLVLSK